MSEEIDNTNNEDDHLFQTFRGKTLISEHNGDDTESELTPEVVNEVPFSERMKTHRFFLVRGIYYIFYSIWSVVMAIGMFLAWLIAMLFI
ncbi:hypothetical protein [Gelidibacter mesophilus]|uniref:hypothetical protein n=1 Tax=Gelidibacter mesophilus TaxID=169050 RepID=UPI00041E7A51|nr:hypothetical protein [Gelidibacter mesophilus]